MKALARHRIMDVHMGRYHTAVVVEPGHVCMMGRNTEGQLGMGNAKIQNAPVILKEFEENLAIVSF